MTMDPNYQKAMTVAFRQIDANRGRYDTNQKQHAMLRELIAMHTLKARMLGQGSRPIPLTVQRYAKMLDNMMTKNGLKPRAGHSWRDRLFLNGTLAIRSDFLKRLQYPPSLSPIVPPDRQEQLAESGSEGSQPVKSLRSKNQERRAPRRTAAGLGSSQLSGAESSLAMRNSGSRHSSISSLSSISTIDTQTGLSYLTASIDPRPICHNSGTTNYHRGDLNETQLEISRASLDCEHTYDVANNVSRTRSTPSSTVFAPPTTPTSPQDQISITTHETPEEPFENRPRMFADPDFEFLTSAHSQAEEVFSSDPADGLVMLDEEQDSASRLYRTPVNTHSSVDIIHRLRLKPLPTAVILQRLAIIKSSSRSAAVYITRELGIDPMTPATWVPTPTPALKTLYCKIYGDEWRHQVLLCSADGMLAFELVQSLITAAWFDLLFGKDMPLPGPDEWMIPLKGVETYVDAVLRRYASTRPMDIKSLFWEAFREKYEDSDHDDDETIKQVANDRAWTFLLTIEPQLRTLRTASNIDSTSYDTWLENAESISKIFNEAVALKALMLASAHYYEHEWFGSGTIIDEQSMAQPHGSTSPGVVNFCTCPAIWLKDTMDSEEILVCKADVVPANRSQAQNTLAGR